jgi:hypothetical protein
MKRTDIFAGSIYTDAKLGVRRVIHLDQAKVFYQTLAAAQATNIRESTMLLGSFAAWAAEQIEPEDLAGHLLSLQARKLAPKLTARQLALFRSLDKMVLEFATVECMRSEWRTARDCYKKGLISELPEKLDSIQEHFVITLSPLGIQVLKTLLAKKQAADSFEHLYFVLDGMEIRNPTLSECGRFAVLPSEYGFVLQANGAWQLPLGDDVLELMGTTYRRISSTGTFLAQADLSEIPFNV